MTKTPRQTPVTFQMFQRAQRLLAAGGAALAVAKQLELSRRVVRSIKEGSHQFQYRTDLVRCPGCGGFVQVPCRLCELRAKVL